jgi:hypothetical protein
VIGEFLISRSSNDATLTEPAFSLARRVEANTSALGGQMWV